MKKSLLLILSLCFWLFSCKVNKLEIRELNNINFCKEAALLLEHFKKDKKALKHFDIDTSNLRLKIDTLVNFGVSSTFVMGADLLYNTANSDKRYLASCFKSLNKDESNVKVTFWYSEKDSLISLDAISILKEPSYSRGYVYLAEINREGNISIIKETSWVE